MDPRVTTSMEDLGRLFDLQRKIAQAIDDDALRDREAEGEQGIEPIRSSCGARAGPVERRARGTAFRCGHRGRRADSCREPGVRRFPEGARSADRRGVEAAIADRPLDEDAMTDERPRVEGHDGLMWIRGSGLCRDWNGIRYKLGMSGKNVGATQLSMNVAVIPPGGVAGSAHSRRVRGDAVHPRRARASRLRRRT